MTEWYTRHPTKKDSPILAFGNGYKTELYCTTLYWCANGWNGEGFYQFDDEYLMEIDDIEIWTHLPIPPKNM